jgi:Mrp family chromosome partitioning ATPase/capsular polysaccharide biosynthesis protein
MLVGCELSCHIRCQRRPILWVHSLLALNAELRSSFSSQGRPEGTFEPYLRAIRTRWPLMLVIVTVALATGIAAVESRSPRYEATARILITPLPQDDRTFLGVQLVRESVDPTRTVQTAATLVKSPEAADLSARRIGQGWTARRVLKAVAVKPEGGTSVLDITAAASSAKGAALVANVFSQAAIDARNAKLKSQVTQIIQGLRARIAREGAGASTADRDQLNQLSAVRDRGDPTLSITQGATPPTSSKGPQPWLVIALSLVAGLTLATGTSLLLGFLDPRIQDEDEVVALYPLPVLARIPPLPSRFRRGSYFSKPLPPAFREGFRTLVAQIDNVRTPRTIMVTSGSSGDGKTLSAINIARALATDQRRVILIDLDVRKPDIGKSIDLKIDKELLSSYQNGAALPSLLVSVPEFPFLRVASAEADAVTDPLFQRLSDIVAEARRLADYVILDTPPLGEVSDALRVARRADEVLLVARPGNTRRANFEQMRDLLLRTGCPVVGLLIIGQTARRSSAYYSYPDLSRARDPGSLLRSYSE